MPCSYSSPSLPRCIAECAPGSTFCVAHTRYCEVGDDVKCAACHQKIRRGTIARINATTGSYEHQPMCPTPRK